MTWTVCITLMLIVGTFVALVYSYFLKVASEEKRRLFQLKNELEIENKVLKEKLLERESFWKETQKNMQETIRLFAKESLSEVQGSFLSFAEKSFSARDEKTIKPFQESFERMFQSFSELKHYCQSDMSSLKGHVDKVQKEASRLAKALTEPTVRGKWGEMHLRRAVEIAGMLPYVDFVEQDQLSSRLRPDMVIRLPMNRTIVVDAKAPFPAREEAALLTDLEEKKGKLQEYSGQVLDHIRRLGKKEYWANVEKAPDFVIMYLPGEAFLLDALFDDASIIEESSRRKVVLATPMTLIAILKLIAQCWTESELEKNIELVLSEAKRAMSHMKRYLDETAKVEKSMVKSLELFHKSQKTMGELLQPSLHLLSQCNLKEVSAPVAPALILEKDSVEEILLEP